MLSLALVAKSGVPSASKRLQQWNYRSSPPWEHRHVFTYWWSSDPMDSQSWRWALEEVWCTFWDNCDSRWKFLQCDILHRQLALLWYFPSSQSSCLYTKRHSMDDSASLQPSRSSFQSACLALPKQSGRMSLPSLQRMYLWPIWNLLVAEWVLIQKLAREWLCWNITKYRPTTTQL